MKKFWFIAILLILVLALANTSLAATSDNKTDPFVFHPFQSVFDEIFFYIGQYYLYDINLGKCQYQLLGQLSPVRQEDQKEKNECLDKYSRYDNPEDAKAMKNRYSSHFGGVGIELKEENGEVVVKKVKENGPAEKAGIKDGDIIIQIRRENGEVAQVKNIQSAIENIRGPVDTSIFITIKRGQEILEFEVIRKDVKTPSVGKKLFSQIGYVYIPIFGDDTADDLEEALRSFQNSGINRVVIDLRHNPGGELNSALEILYYFSRKDSDILLKIKYKNSEVSHTIKSLSGGFVNPKTKQVKSPGEFSDMKIVILTGRISASASEVIAGTLQDWGYKIIGETSFGKGVGQSVFPLIDGSSFSLTTFEFLVGNGLRRVNGIGIKPDIEIKWEKKPGQTNEDFVEEYINSFDDPLKDPQLKRALEELNKL